MRLYTQLGRSQAYCLLEYSKDCFSPEAAAFLLRNYVQVLETLSVDRTGTRVSALAPALALPSPPKCLEASSEVQPLSWSQRWGLQQIALLGPGAMRPWRVRLHVPQDQGEQLQRTLVWLVRQHKILRTKLCSEGQTVVAVYTPAVHQAAPADFAAAAAATAEALDHTTGRMVGATVCRGTDLAEVAIHGLGADLPTVHMLVEQLVTALDFAAPATDALQYVDFVHWQQSLPQVVQQRAQVSWRWALWRCLCNTVHTHNSAVVCVL